MPEKNNNKNVHLSFRIMRKNVTNRIEPEVSGTRIYLLDFYEAFTYVLRLPSQKPDFILMFSGCACVCV